MRFMPAAMNTPDKQARLAQALRDNLRRRKAQARAAEEAPAAAPRDGAEQPDGPPSSE
jgi:hypothetical protein